MEDEPKAAYDLANIISKTGKLSPILNETDQLIRIFVSSISTGGKRRNL